MVIIRGREAYLARLPLIFLLAFLKKVLIFRSVLSMIKGYIYFIRCIVLKSRKISGRTGRFHGVKGLL